MEYASNNNPRYMCTKRGLTSVTGFSLQTNNTFSGGFISASGMSPICKAQVRKITENPTCTEV